MAKLGLYDLSLRHVSMSATPWESPLFRYVFPLDIYLHYLPTCKMHLVSRKSVFILSDRLRAMLVFQPVHSSVRSLAMSVDNFEKQGESILVQSSRKNRASMMDKVCNSLNQISLAIQALPLLHLAGYTSPRDELVIGHSAVALPVLLSEVYIAICASTFLPSNNSVSQTMRWNKVKDASTSEIQGMYRSRGDDEVVDGNENWRTVEKGNGVDSVSNQGDVDWKQGKMKLWDEEDEEKESRGHIISNEVILTKPKLIKIGFISGKNSLQ